MNKKIATIILAAISLSGCSVTKIPYASGGSRSDGFVNLEYTYGGFEKPQIDWHQSKERATEKCKLWGYEEAVKFGAKKERCIDKDQYGCSKYEVTIPFQCIGGPK